MFIKKAGDSRYLKKMKKILKDIYFNYLWWIWQTILVLVCVFFFILGIQILIESYQLDNPFYFMMIFFSSNLIILIAAVLMAGLVWRMIGVYRLVHGKNNKKIK